VIRLQYIMLVRPYCRASLVGEDDLDPIQKAKRATPNSECRSTSRDRIEPRDKLVFKQQYVHMRRAVLGTGTSVKAARFALCCIKLRRKRAPKKREIPTEVSGRVKLVKIGKPIEGFEQVFHRPQMRFGDFCHPANQFAQLTSIKKTAVTAPGG